MFTTREDLSWAAGIVDGEGCFSTNKTRIHFSVAQSSRDGIPEILLKLKRVTGLGRIYGPFKDKRTNRQPNYQWQVDGPEKVQAFLAMVWEWLGTIKREQAVHVLQVGWQTPVRLDGYWWCNLHRRNETEPFSTAHGCGECNRERARNYQRKYRARV
jgi:hypothetical protein